MKVSRMRREQIKVLFHDFLSHSSMHGLKYTVQTNRSWSERASWMIFFLLGIGFSIYMSIGMWQKYESSILLTSINSTHEPLNSFSFPSVTVCSQNRFSRAKLNRIRKENTHLRELTENDFQLIFKILTHPDASTDHVDQLRTVQKALDANGINITQLVNFTHQAMVSCDDFMIECEWENEGIPCSELFTMRPTDQGFCCGFNYRLWGKDGDAIPLNQHVTKIYDKVNIGGWKNGLSVMLDTYMDDFLVPFSRSDGFKVLIHGQQEYAQVGDLGFSISPGFETFAGMEPHMIDITAEVDSLSQSKRSCFRTRDKTLQFYNKYSFSNCIIECLTQHMVSRCKCRPFFLAAFDSDRICNVDEHICLNAARDEFKKDPFPSQCKCLPSCKQIWYSTEFSIGSFPSEGFFELAIARRIEKMNRQIPMTKEYFKKNVAVLNVHYNQKTGYTYQTDTLYGWKDMISSVGGLLGLGVGFSFISIIEVLYFLGVRCLYKSKKCSDTWRNGRVLRVRKRKPQHLQAFHKKISLSVIES